MRSKLQQRLDELYAHARIAQFCSIAWERLQPSPESQTLWDTLNVFQLWAKERKQSLPLAVIECCAACDLISQGEREQLIRELGEAQQRSAKPKFDREKGKLEFGGRLVRKVRLQRKAPTAPFRILDAFETASWREWIEWPDDDTIDDAVYGLNEGLQDLKFYVCNRKIYWQLASRGCIAVLAR